jgi:hypothetical protein
MYISKLTVDCVLTVLIQGITCIVINCLPVLFNCWEDIEMDNKVIDEFSDL